MKKNYFLLSLLFLSSTLFSQNLTVTDIGYKAGETYKNFMTTTEVAEGPMGTNVTWDLSDITDTTSILNTVSVNSGGSFPTANFVITNSDGNKSYVKQTSTSIDIVGIVVPNFTTMSYSDPASYFTLPLTTATNKVDNFKCSFSSSGFAFVREGTIKSEFSGSGTLITPYGTYTNVVRIKTTLNFSDTYSGGKIYTSQVSYNWYKSGIHHEVANVSYVNGSFNYAYYSDAALNVGLEEQAAFNFATYPNPLSNELTINSEEALSKVMITSLSGELIQTIDVNNENNLTVSFNEMESGIYFVVLKGSNGQTVTRRIQKI